MIDLEKIFKGPLPEEFRLKPINDDMEEDEKDKLTKENDAIESELNALSDEEKDAMRPWILESVSTLRPLEFNERSEMWSEYCTPKVQIMGDRFNMRDMDINLFGLQRDAMTAVCTLVILNGTDSDGRVFTDFKREITELKDWDGIPLCVCDHVSKVVMDKYFRAEEE